MQRSARLLLTALALVACGGPAKPPERGVIEADIGGWDFRRYQSVLDVEVWVPDNQAVAHTASYARVSAQKRGRLGESDVVNAFVTRYERDDGIVRALVVFARRLAQESGYRVEETVIEDTRVIAVAGGGEQWLLWAAPRHVVKLGGRTEVPADLVEAYAERYPSRLTAGILEGPLPPGPEAKEPEAEPFDPDFPEPEWQ